MSRSRPWYFNQRADLDRMRELAPLAKLGDTEATEELLRHAYPWVSSIRYAKGWFLTDGDTEDLVQVGVIAILEALRNWNPDGFDFIRFAKLVVTRRMANAIQSSNYPKRAILSRAYRLDAPVRRGKHGLTDDETYLEHLRELVVPDPAEALIDRGPGWQELLAMLTSELTSLERTAITEIAIRRRPYQTVAAESGKSPRSIDNGLQRARRKMRETTLQLASCGEIPEEYARYARR